jgi:CubicO group peptidase (beta-lactamase class C family)
MKVKNEVLETIDRCFGEFYAAHKNPGLQFAVTYRGEVIHAGALGSRTLHPELPMTRSSISRIASMTKSFATAATLRLRDAGLVDIDTRLSDIVPHLSLAEPFLSCSLRDLMAMRLDLPVDDPWADRLLGASNQELDQFFATPLIRAGRGCDECTYSNLSYLLLGRVIAHLSKSPAMEYITDEILTPLTLKDTVWNPSLEQSKRAAIGYRVDCEPHQSDHAFTCRSDGVVFGGLWSTVDDLAVWLEFLRADPDSPPAWNSVLSIASRRELSGRYSRYPVPSITSLITREPLYLRADYGFGLARSTVGGEEYIAHSGGIPGYGSHMRVHSSTGFGVVALGNGTYCQASVPCTAALHYLVNTLKEDSGQSSGIVREIGVRLAEFIRSGASAHDGELFSYNFWLDNLHEHLQREIHQRLRELGQDLRVQSIVSVSGYQGEIVFAGSSGVRKVEFRLAPHLPARVQAITWLG